MGPQQQPEPPNPLLLDALGKLFNALAEVALYTTREDLPKDLEKKITAIEAAEAAINSLPSQSSPEDPSPILGSFSEGLTFSHQPDTSETTIPIGKERSQAIKKQAIQYLTWLIQSHLDEYILLTFPKPATADETTQEPRQPNKYISELLLTIIESRDERLLPSFIGALSAQRSSPLNLLNQLPLAMEAIVLNRALQRKNIRSLFLNHAPEPDSEELWVKTRAVLRATEENKHVAKKMIKSTYPDLTDNEAENEYKIWKALTHFCDLGFKQILFLRSRLQKLAPTKALMILVAISELGDSLKSESEVLLYTQQIAKIFGKGHSYSPNPFKGWKPNDWKALDHTKISPHLSALLAAERGLQQPSTDATRVSTAASASGNHPSEPSPQSTQPFSSPGPSSAISMCSVSPASSSGVSSPENTPTVITSLATPRRVANPVAPNEVSLETKIKAHRNLYGWPDFVNPLACETLEFESHLIERLTSPTISPAEKNALLSLYAALLKQPSLANRSEDEIADPLVITITRVLGSINPREGIDYNKTIYRKILNFMSKESAAYNDSEKITLFLSQVAVAEIIDPTKFYGALLCDLGEHMEEIGQKITQHVDWNKINAFEFHPLILLNPPGAAPELFLTYLECTQLRMNDHSQFVKWFKSLKKLALINGLWETARKQISQNQTQQARLSRLFPPQSPQETTATNPDQPLAPTQPPSP